jgi:phosphohistidine phosphatase
MRLYFLRHGQAGRPEEWPHPDAERPLSKRGIEETHAAARGMRWLDLKVELVLSSPLVRAHQTALICAEALQREVTIAPGLASGCTLGTLASVLAAHLPVPPVHNGTTSDAEPAEPAPRGVLLVGHEPDFSTLLGAIIGRRGNAAIQLKKGALCRVELESEVDGWRWSPANLHGSGTLVWLLTAKQLGRLGK